MRQWLILLTLLTTFIPTTRQVAGSIEELQECGRNEYFSQVEKLIAEGLDGTPTISATITTLPIGPEWGIDILKNSTGSELVLTELKESLISKNVEMFGAEAPKESLAKTRVDTEIHRREIAGALTEKLQVLWAKADDEAFGLRWICFQCFIYHFKTFDRGCASAMKREPGTISYKLTAIVDGLRELARERNDGKASALEAAILKETTALIADFH